MYNPLHIAGARRRRARVGLEINDPRRPPVGGGGGSPIPAPPWNPPTGGPGFPVLVPTFTPGGGGNGSPGGPTFIPGGGGNGSPGGPDYIPSGGGPGIPNPPGPAIPGPGIPTIPNMPGCAPQCFVCPEDQKRYYLPFVPDAGFTASVTAGSQVRFIGRPQKLFKPDRLIVGSTITPYFDIVSLTIGNIPQSLAAGNVGADMFSEVATYVMMTFDQAYPGIDIILVAQNKSSVTQTFQAQLIGEAVG